MFYAIKIVLIEVGSNKGAEYPEIHGPFDTSEEQKAWIRNESAAKHRVYWLDLDRNRAPSAGRVTKVDGHTELV